jgi:hypothetical protein
MELDEAVLSFSVTHRDGSLERSPSLSSLPNLLRELEEYPEDLEHGSVAVTHESEWSLSVSRDRSVSWENLESGEPRHQRGLSDAKILDLWTQLALGNLAGIETEPWKPGYR